MTNQIGEAIREIMNPTSYTIAIIAYIIMFIAQWKIFKKAGVPGWMAFIPILNIYKICKIADGNGWKFLLFLIPVVNIIYYVLLNIRFAKAYGKSTAFGVGLIFLNTIFLYILAFGKAEYIGPRGEKNYNS